MDRKLIDIKFTDEYKGVRKEHFLKYHVNSSAEKVHNYIKYLDLKMMLCMLKD